jgi:hypothetical protein
MSFNIGIITEILRFPWPLFPKYKYIYHMGQRFDIPALQQDYTFTVQLPADNKYELLSLAFASTGYKDGDNFSLKLNDKFILSTIYTKELGQVKEIKPVRKIDPSLDTLTFIYSNITGSSKVIWVDFDLTSQKEI